GEGSSSAVLHDGSPPAQRQEGWRQGRVWVTWSDAERERDGQATAHQRTDEAVSAHPATGLP
ncbi:unnamed protein product, partial [Closterium sp. NIES-54]